MGLDSMALGSLGLQAAQGERMQTPEEVAAMLRLHGLGWGSRRIAAQLGCSRTTVKRYVSAAGWLAYRRPGRPRKLAGQTAWLQERLIRHRGNADVVRQDLERELGIVVGLRTLEREVAPLRQALAAEARVDALKKNISAGNGFAHATPGHEGFLRTGAGVTSFAALSASARASLVPSIASCKVSL